ncbi:hypothetical protein [Beggiatoa leptomitoformis]|uniref:Uncharacterized protein n=1 Tax=Beggiatoa leptomitoformis TaxID=288004 RepID=A0A2N9YDV7_9GAMM|nr:hypothetical protein [Beggiatoa leptomitoformis]ALG69039.1 hypothetical protein AL038_16795 [Beggiatoa leptomitoformis]AUI68555.1 hypothetical protein BLE401_07445 [Beggiatoa leptomitoformis]
MNILWIEDFGAEGEQKTMFQAIFKELLPSEVCDAVLNNNALDLADNPEDLTVFLEKLEKEAFFKNRVFHSIDLRGNYHGFTEICSKKVQDIDVVLLDLSLGADPESIRPSLKENGYERKKGGLYLYNYLIYSGFPKENICIFTGEAESLKEFVTACKTMLIPQDKKPNAFEKNTKGYNELRDWLKQQEQSRYLTLRRGIINACQFIKKHIKDSNENLQFQHFLKEKPDISELKANMADYLDTLEKFLPLIEPVNKEGDYKLFIRTLAHEWEDNASPKNLNLTTEDKCLSAFGWIMKCTRNWIAHNGLQQPFDEKSVAFLFIVAMRSMFKLEENVQGYETILFSLLTSAISATDMKKIIKNREIPLAQTFITARDELKSKTPEEKSFNEVLDTLNRKKANYDYIKGLHQIYWLTLPKATVTSDVPVKQQGDEWTCTTTYRLDELHSYGKKQFEKNPDSFLFHFSRHIYPYSF